MYLQKKLKKFIDPIFNYFKKSKLYYFKLYTKYYDRKPSIFGLILVLGPLKKVPEKSLC